VPNTKTSSAPAARQFREPSPQPQPAVPRKQPPRAGTETALGEEVLTRFNSGVERLAQPATDRRNRAGWYPSEVGHAPVERNLLLDTTIAWARIGWRGLRPQRQAQQSRMGEMVQLDFQVGIHWSRLPAGFWR
jgi:hypothetical protein